MSRNTVYALIGLFAIAAGTLTWKWWNNKGIQERQQRLTAVLERTEDAPGQRIVSLDSVLAEYPDDEMLQRLGVHHLLQAHAEIGSDSTTLTRLGRRYASMDSSWWAYYSIAAAYADGGANLAEGLDLMDRALAQVREMPQPETLTAEKWQAQLSEMVGHCRFIRGKLFAEMGRQDSALVQFRAAADSVRDSHEFLMWLGDTYSTLGMLDQALDTYMQVVRLKYDHDEARSAIRRLYPMVGRRGYVDQVLDTLVQNARMERRDAILADRVSRPCPSFDLTGRDGENYTLESLEGQVVVMDVWATWCGPCRRKFPEYQAAYDRYGSRPDVTFLAVSVDETPEVIEPFLDRYGYTFPTAHGGREFGRAMEVEGIPTLFVIDPEGVIRHVELGFNDTGDFVEELGWKIEDALVIRPDAPADTTGAALP